MDLKGRDFLKLKDFTPEEITYLIDLAAELKRKKKEGVPHDEKKGRNIALIFEKTSTRTRCAFEVAAHDMGMHVTYLDPSGSRRECLGGCLTASNTGGSGRRSWRNWRATRTSRSGTD